MSIALYRQPYHARAQRNKSLEILLELAKSLGRKRVFRTSPLGNQGPFDTALRVRIRDTGEVISRSQIRHWESRGWIRLLRGEVYDCQTWRIQPPRF